MGIMSAGGSNLPDRNTVGKNGAVGINDNYPEVALNIGHDTQTTTALNGEQYLAIRVPNGEYKGESYVGEALSTVKNIIKKPEFVVSGSVSVATKCILSVSEGKAQGWGESSGNFTNTINPGSYRYCQIVSVSGVSVKCNGITYSSGTFEPRGGSISITKSDLGSQATTGQHAPGNYHSNFITKSGSYTLKLYD